MWESYEKLVSESSEIKLREKIVWESNKKKWEKVEWENSKKKMVRESREKVMSERRERK